MRAESLEIKAIDIEKGDIFLDETGYEEWVATADAELYSTGGAPRCSVKVKYSDGYDGLDEKMFSCEEYVYIERPIT